MSITTDDMQDPGQEEAVLTARELEILQCLSTGIPYKEAAPHLCVALGTLKNHVHNIMAKLGARTFLEAVHLARCRGLI